MKKIISILLCFIFILSSCQEEDIITTTINNGNNSSNSCGNVEMNINGDLQSTYNPTQSMCYTANMISYVPAPSNQLSVGLAFSSNCSTSQLPYPDYSVSFPGATANVTTDDILTTPLIIRQATYYNYNCQSTPSTTSYVDINGVGILNITAFNDSNNPILISGSFYISSPGKASISCTFTNLPCTMFN